MKVCFKCGVPKHESEFYRHAMMADGLLGKCKECTKLDVRNNYQANRVAYAQYEKMRETAPSRKAAKLEYQRRRRARHPEKNVARASVGNAVRDGKLVRQPCRDCGNPKSQAHHADYSKPLDVIWLCFACHCKVHGKEVIAA